MSKKQNPGKAPGKRLLFLSLPLLFLLASCFGLKMDITLNRNGSGTLALEYKISKAVDSLGKQDGNERWSTIPVGKADFERSLSRLPEIKLVSFASKEDEKNLIITADMEFSSVNGLLAFLDASGSRSTFSGDAASGRLGLVLSGGGESNKSLSELIGNISETYSLDISMTFPGEGAIALYDDAGNTLNAFEGRNSNRGKKVSASIPLSALLSSSEGITAEFRW